MTHSVQSRSREAARGTQLTRELETLMDAAKLAPEWRNYRLDAVQTDFFAPKLLGNSIIEGENVGMNLTQASCISCHAVCSVKSDGTDSINLLAAMTTLLSEPPGRGVPQWSRPNRLAPDLRPGSVTFGKSGTAALDGGRALARK